MKTVAAVLVTTLVLLTAKQGVSQQVIELKPPSEQLLTGVIKMIDSNGHLVVSVQTAPGATGHEISIILNDETAITLDGRVAKASDLRAGHAVTVNYVAENRVAILKNVPTGEVTLRTARRVSAVSATPQTVFGQSGQQPGVEQRFRLEQSKTAGGFKFFKVPGEPFDMSAGAGTEIMVDGDSFAGLGAFARGTRLHIEDDGTLVLDRGSEGLVVSDRSGKKWATQKIKLNDKELTVFLPVVKPER
jgi:hypothetical protein